MISFKLSAYVPHGNTWDMFSNGCCTTVNNHPITDFGLLAINMDVTYVQHNIYLIIDTQNQYSRNWKY